MILKMRRQIDGQVLVDPYYSVRVKLPAGSDTKYFTKRNAFPTRQDAAKWERQLKLDIKAGWVTKQLDRLRSRAVGLTVAALVEEYRAAGYPDRRGRARDAEHLSELPRQLTQVAAGLGMVHPAKLTAKHLQDYVNFRRGTVSRGTGERTAELEICMLSAVLDWAVLQERVATNPIARRTRFVDAESVRHANEVMPASAEQLHAIAARLLADRRSEVHGWQYMLCAMTGLRCGESRKLLANPRLEDPQHPEPGWTSETHFWFSQSKKRGLRKRNPERAIPLDDVNRPWIRPLLERIRQWHAVRYPQSPWLLPGRGGAQLSKESLTKALTKVCKELGIPHRTAHGARAFYASVRCSQDIPMNQIAGELGHTSGDDLIRSVYGQDPASWQGLPVKYQWVPSAAPAAWDAFEAPANIIAI